MNSLVRTLGVMAGISILSACTPSEQTLTAEGKRVFSAKGCSDCHASGSSRGPDLSHIGEQKSRSALETWVRNPVVLTSPGSNPILHMPTLNLTAKESEALAAYLSTIK